jgi:2'-5' RNA ligase
MGLVVLAFPEISQKDFEFIQSFRKTNDRYYPIVNPHFTLVFPAYEINENEFVDHIVKTAADFKKIEFSLNCAITVKDSFSEFWDIFLIPEKGNSAIIKLHDAFYRGPLITHLRIDIPFIPHMGIGNDVDPFHCINLARDLNDSDIAIPGIISGLSIGHYDGTKVEIIKELTLK